MEGLEQAIRSYMESARPDEDSSYTTILTRKLLAEMDHAWENVKAEGGRPQAYKVMYRCPHTRVRVTILIEPGRR